MANYSEISVTSDQTYTSCYCEENVWNLCDKIDKSKLLAENQKAFVIFISNKNYVGTKSVPPFTLMLVLFHFDNFNFHFFVSDKK